MREHGHLLCAGLTGGIGCGKTTVGRMLESRGCRLIDADRIGHELMQPGRDAYEEIVLAFGSGILDESGIIQRKRLGAIVFADARRRRELEAILHPRIIAEEQRLLDLHAVGGVPGISIVEATLMVEAGSWRRYDRLIVVTASPELQIVRMESRGWSEAEARARMEAQMPVAEKAALADYVVENGGSLDALREKVGALHLLLEEDLRSKSAGTGLPSRH